WINLHFSLLPAWRGAAPVQWSLLQGDEITGATTFLIGPGLDDGPVFGSVTERILPTDTAADLLDRLGTYGSSLLVATLDALEAGEVHPVDQPTDGVTFAPKLSIDDARVRWQDPWVGVDRRIRATTPAPGAWTTLEGERVKIGPLQLNEAMDLPALDPGALHVTRASVWVGTATKPACLGMVQPAGRKLMNAADWARGLSLAGLRFE
ncbi:MAG: methionyl-tRNA formyltransferase, partial [Candidatus Nanopelagicales bacterium]